MTTDKIIKHEKVIHEYFQEKKERYRILEKNRLYKEKILERRREIEENRKINIVPEECVEVSTECIEKEIDSDVGKKTITCDEKVQIIDENDDDDIEYDEDESDIEEDEEENDFALWLRSITQCLSGKISHDQPPRPPTPESEEEDEEELDEDVRCMKVVKSVFDEETATLLVKSYLKYSKVIKF